MVDIFEEVDEELRRDKYDELTRKYLPWALGAAGAIVLGATAYWAWESWTTSRGEASSETYFAALDQYESGELALADAGFETLSETGAGGYPALALMNRGSIALEQGNPEEAAALFEQAAAATGEAVVSDLAELKAAWARWPNLSFNDIELRLTPLTDDTDPYRFLAREAIAAAALRDGNIERARDDYQFLSFQLETPEGVRRRSQEALAMIAQHDALAPAEAGDETTPNAGEAGDD